MTKALFIIGLVLTQLAMEIRKIHALDRKENERVARDMIDRYRKDHPEIFVKEILARNRERLHQ